MLIKFKSEQSGDFVMMSDIAIPLLKLMGASGKSEGAVSKDALHDALSQLESGLKQQQNAESNTEDDDEEQEPAIALSTRAAPLLAMLRKAAAEDGYVMWQED
ncbi:MAG: DUF1840 domain-containing protein [Gammaproteobacteria bacterium]